MKNEEPAVENRESEVGDDDRRDSDNEALMRPEIRAAFEPTCCGSGCVDCPF